MSRLLPVHLTLERQGHIALIAVVAIGYFMTFLAALSQETFPFTPVESIASIVMGTVYLVLALREDRFFARFPSAWGTASYFIIQLTLTLTVQYLIGPGAIWLILLPLAATAVERLSPLWRWPVYLALLSGVAMPLGFRYRNWEDAFYFTLTFSPAILFVVVFTQMRQSEQRAREEAEALTAQLAAVNRQLAANATQAADLAASRERNRLAREIHDNLGHYLTIINVQIGAARVVMPNDPQRATDALDKAQKLTQEGLAAVRQSIAALRESPMGNRPLAEAISLLIDESRSAGIVTELDIKGIPRPLEPRTELALYRVAQEGLTNVRKHANASRIDLTLDYGEAKAVRLVVKDNGVGTAAPNGGFGLIGVHERVQLLGGNVEVTTDLGQGFTLAIAIPVSGEPITTA